MAYDWLMAGLPRSSDSVVRLFGLQDQIRKSRAVGGLDVAARLTAEGENCKKKQGCARFRIDGLRLIGANAMPWFGGLFGSHSIRNRARFDE